MIGPLLPPHWTMPNASPIVLHVDMDCFYVSVERLLDPALEGRPVAVGGTSDRRGVVSSASYEARAFGVRAAMPMAQALRLCPPLVVVPGSYGRYAEYSRAILEVLQSFSPMVEMASQDEAYLDLAGTERLWGSPLQAAERLRGAVLERTRLPCSLGIGANKLIAKVASALCKPRGLLWVPPGSEESFLGPLPVGAIPGVGEKSGGRLRAVGVQRVRDLRVLGRERLEAHFGELGRMLWERAHGVHESPVQAGGEAKSVGAEETFAQDLSDPALLAVVLSQLAERVAPRLRADGARARTLTLKYRYANFETHTAATTLAAPTDDEGVLLAAGRELLATRWNPSRPLRLLGLSATGLLRGEWQMDLLDAPADPRRRALHAAMDRLRARHGSGAVQLASSLEPAREAEDDSQPPPPRHR